VSDEQDEAHTRAKQNICMCTYLYERTKGTHVSDEQDETHTRATPTHVRKKAHLFFAEQEETGRGASTSSAPSSCGIPSPPIPLLA